MPERVYASKFNASGATNPERWADWLGLSLPKIPSPTSEITEAVVGGLDDIVNQNRALALLAAEADAVAKKEAASTKAAKRKRDYREKQKEMQNAVQDTQQAPEPEQLSPLVTDEPAGQAEQAEQAGGQAEQSQAEPVAECEPQPAVSIGNTTDPRPRLRLRRAAQPPQPASQESVLHQIRRIGLKLYDAIPNARKGDTDFQEQVLDNE